MYLFTNSKTHLKLLQLTYYISYFSPLSMTWSIVLYKYLRKLMEWVD